MTKFLLSVALLFLVGCSGGDDGFDKYKTPTLDNSANMSADTLCYRYAYAKENRSLKEEVRNRGLDCAAILESQGTYSDSRIEHE